MSIGVNLDVKEGRLVTCNPCKVEIYQLRQCFSFIDSRIDIPQGHNIITSSGPLAPHVHVHPKKLKWNAQMCGL